MKIKVITPVLRGGTLAYAPHFSSRITAVPGGLEIHHHAAGPVDFEDLRMMCVIAAPGGSGIDLLLFIDSSKRPFATSADLVQYSDFPLENATTTERRLREFGLYLLLRNSKLGVDRGTYEFLLGRPAPELDRDVTALTTTLGEILEQTASP